MNKMKKFFINALILLLNIIIIVAFMSVILDGESIPAAVAIAVIPIFGVFALIKKNWFVYLPNTPEETDETPNQVSKRKISLSDKKSMAIVLSLSIVIAVFSATNYELLEVIEPTQEENSLSQLLMNTILSSFGTNDSHFDFSDFSEEEIQKAQENISMYNLNQQMMTIYFNKEDLLKDGGIDFPEPISADYSAKLDEMFQNIYINNSRFALPMNVKDLPKGFTLGEQTLADKEACVQELALEMANLYFENEQIGNVILIKPAVESAKAEVICSMFVLAAKSKNSLGGLKGIANAEEIETVLGSPLLQGELSRDFNSMMYLSESGGLAMFIPKLSGFSVAYTANEKMTEEVFQRIKQKADDNKSYIESHPYDDFKHLEKLPPLSGEPREIDWTNAPDRIIIGDNTYPMFFKISELSDNFVLSDYEVNKEYRLYDGFSEDYYQDRYLLLYMERDIGQITAFRKKDESPENAIVISFIFTDIDTSPVPISVWGIPIDTERSEIEKFYPSDTERTGVYRSLLSDNNKEYFCVIWADSNRDTFAVSFTPLEVDPSAYERYLENRKNTDSE